MRIGRKAGWLAAALAAASAAGATGQFPEPAQELEQVSVTASRIGPVDQRVVTLDEDDIRAAAVHHGADLLRMLPGLALSPSGNRGSLTQARVRGAEANHLLVTVDGFPVNDPAMDSAFDFGTLDLAGVSRLDLLSGAHSSVWGSDAMAGVINLETLPRDTGRRVALGYGTHGTIDADVDLARVGERWRMRLSLGHVESDGENVAASGDEADGFANDTVHVSSAYHGERWHQTVVARWSDADVQFDRTPFPAYTPTDGDRSSVTRAALVGWRARYDGWRRLSPWISVSSSRSRSRHAADGGVTSGTDGRRTTVAAAANFAWSERQRANATAETRRDSFAQQGLASDFGDPNQRQTFTSSSVALEYQARLGWAGFTASGRFDDNGEFDDASAFRVGVTAPAFGGRLFANAGEGVKNPTFIERFGYLADTFLGNPALRPEWSRSVEAGVERAFGAVTLTALAFDTVLADEIDGFYFDPAAGGFTARNLDGDSRRTGAELTFGGRLGAVTVRGNYAFVDATQEDDTEVRRPRHLAGVTADAPLRRGVSLHVGVSHNGPQFDNDFSTWPATRVRLDGFTLVRASLAWAATASLTARLTAENVLDADYMTVHGFRSPGFSALLAVEYSN